MKILDKIYDKFHFLPDLTPIDGKTWFKEFSKISLVNFLLTTSLTIVMYLNTTLIGYLLYTFLFWVLFIALIVNDINYFVISMERLMDAHLSPYLVYPLFITTLLLIYLGKIVAIQVFSATSFVSALFVILPILAINVLFYRYIPSKPDTTID